MPGARAVDPHLWRLCRHGAHADAADGFGNGVEGFQEHFGHIEPISFVCKNNPPSQSGSMNGASRRYIEQTGDDFPPEAKGIVNDVIGLQFPDFVKKLGDIFQRTPSENCG